MLTRGYPIESQFFHCSTLWWVAVLIAKKNMEIQLTK